MNMPSSWAAGIGFGLCLAAALGLAALDRGQPVPWDRCIAVTVLGFGLVPSLEFAARATWAIVTAVGGAILEWQERTRYVPPDDPEPDEEPGQREIDRVEYDRQQAWALALDRFFRAGDSAGGFSIRRLGGVVGSDTWGGLVHFYGSELGGNVLRDAGGDTGYTWGHGWSLDRVTMALHAGKLPYPDMPVPVVQLFVAPATRRDTKRRATTPKEPPPRVIENVPGAD
jgi:hypothetical protein